MHIQGHGEGVSGEGLGAGGRQERYSVLLEHGEVGLCPSLCAAQEPGTWPLFIAHLDMPFHSSINIKHVIRIKYDNRDKNAWLLFMSR